MKRKAFKTRDTVGNGDGGGGVGCGRKGGGKRKKHSGVWKNPKFSLQWSTNEEEEENELFLSSFEALSLTKENETRRKRERRKRDDVHRHRCNENYFWRRFQLISKRVYVRNLPGFYPPSKPSHQRKKTKRGKRERERERERERDRRCSRVSLQNYFWRRFQLISKRFEQRAYIERDVHEIFEAKKRGKKDRSIEIL